MSEPRNQPDPEPSGTAGQAPSVLICDTGDLEDVHELLVQVGVRPLRVRPEELADLAAWERPDRLLVTTARIAISHEEALLPLVREAVSIAVTQGDVQTICAGMLRRGFHYVVRRPVHPEALRLLMLQVLFTGREQRRVSRFSFGARVRWRSGLRRGACTMTEVSAHGCRLLAGSPFRIGRTVRLRVPPALPTAWTLRLRGEVVRQETVKGPSGEPDLYEVGVRFGPLSDRTRAHLDALLAERASGPALLPAVPDEIRAPAPAPTGARPSRPRSRFLSLTEPPADAAGEADRQRDSPPAVDRRRRPRARWQREVVAIDEAERAMQTFMGADLSTGGLRVEPHPLLRLGDRLNLALFDAGRIDPLIVPARVARDDGPRGFGLVFEPLDDERRARLEQMIAGLPPVSVLDEDKQEPEAVVLGEIHRIDAEEGTGR